MKALKTAMIAASVGAIVAMSAGAASAGPISFTWDPSQSSPPLTTLPGAAFTTSDITIADYALINATNPADVLESAVLVAQNLNTSSAPGFEGNAGAAGAGNYQIYFDLTAHSYFDPTTLQGAFTSLSYMMYGVAGGGCTFTVGAGMTGPQSAGCSSTPTLLATGNLGPGFNAVSLNGGASPSANANATINPAAGEQGFFVSPTAASLALSDLFATGFSNSSLAASYCDITGSNCETVYDGGRYSAATPVIKIVGGGGDINMAAIPVPEPLTLSLFAAGLVGAGALRRRRRAKMA